MPVNEHAGRKDGKARSPLANRLSLLLGPTSTSKPSACPLRPLPDPLTKDEPIPYEA